MSLEVVAVSVGDAWAAIEASVVVEVVGARAWTPLVEAAPATPGVLPWRGRAIAAVDVGALAPAFPRLAEGERRSRVVVVDVGGATLGLPVDAVREVQEIGQDAVRPAPAERPSIRGILDVEGVQMPLLDLSGLVPERRA